MNSASSDPGVYGPEAWPGAQTGWGVSATSLSVAGGLITLEDLERGQINHALALAIPNARAGEYASPAQRTDGYSSELTSLPEGAHLRLDPVSTLLVAPPTLDAGDRRSGTALRDLRAGLGSECGVLRAGSNPHRHQPVRGRSRLLRREISAAAPRIFPWHSLEVLKMELH